MYNNHAKKPMAHPGARQRLFPILALLLLMCLSAFAQATPAFASARLPQGTGSQGSQTSGSPDRPLVQILCVDDNIPSPIVQAPCSNAGSPAYGSIQAALGVAVDGDEIRVASGAYTGAGTAVAVVSMSVTITGGYAGGTTGWATSVNATSTIVDGQGARRSFEIVGAASPTIQQLDAHNGGFLNNAGAVNISFGTLNISDGGSSNGTFNIAGGAFVNFPSGSHTLLDNTVFNGPGQVTFTGGNVILVGTVGTGNITVHNFSLGPNAVLSGSGDLTITGLLQWTGGTMDGPFPTGFVPAARTIMAPGSSVIMGGVNTTKTLIRRYFINNGTFTLNGTGIGTFVMSDSTVFTNTAGAMFDIQNNDNINYGTGEFPTFTNLGTVRKSAGSGVSNLGTGFLKLENNGAMQVMAGTLNLGGGSNLDPDSRGSFAVSYLATLRFSGTHNLLSASSITGAGNVDFTAGDTDITGAYNLTGVTNMTGGSVKFDTNATSIYSTLSGPSTIMSGDGTFNTLYMIWNGGTMTNRSVGMGVTNLSATGIMTVAGVTSSKFLSGRTFNNNGSVRLNGTGVGTFYINNNGTFNNSSTASFDIQNNDSVLYNAGTSSRFSNDGLVRKSGGSGMTTFGSGNLTFDNNGAVEVLTGTLSLDGGGSIPSESTGTFSLADQTTLRFNAGNHTLEPASTIMGMGNVTVSGGTTSIAGGYDITGLTTITGGTVNFNTNASTANVNMSGGFFGGDAPFNFTITGIFNWTGGTMNGPSANPGTTTLGSSGTLNLGGVGTIKTLVQRTFYNNGTVLVNGTNIGTLSIGNGASFYNNAGGTFDIRNNDNITFGTGVAAVFTNTGSLLKSGGGATSILGSGNLSFNNVGSVNVMTGTLTMNGGGISPGSFTGSTVANLRFGGGTHTLQPGSSVTGAGNVEFTAGVVNVAGSYDVVGNTNVAGGTVNFNSPTGATSVFATESTGVIGGTGPFTVNNTLDWTGGTMNGSGSTNIAPTATLNLAGLASTKTLSERTFNNYGTTDVNGGGAGTLTMSVGAIFNNRAGATFNIQNNDRIIFGSGLAPTFNNAGNLVKSLSPGTATIGTGSLVFNNTGTISLLSGVLSFGPNFNQSAGLTVLNGGNLSGSGNLVFGGGTLSGSGIVTATLQNSALLTPGDSPGIITVSGQYRQNAPGALNIEIGGTNPGVDQDKLVATSTTTFSGALNISMINGYSPPLGTVFTIITHGTRTGTFTSITGLDLGNNRMLVPTYNANSFTLTVATGTPPSPTVTPTPPPGSCTITFTDVPVGSTFHTYILCLACRNILGGYTDGTFRPGNSITRGQLSKIVSNAAAFAEDPGPQRFEDVPPGSTFYDWVNRLAGRGHIGGYPCGGTGEPCGGGNLPYFRTGANATRGQISKIVANAAGMEDVPGEQLFQDVPTSNPFFDFIQRLSNRGIIGGYACGSSGEPCIPPQNRPYFRPGANATRGQTSKIVSNTFFPECNTR